MNVRQIRSSVCRTAGALLCGVLFAGVPVLYGQDDATGGHSGIGGFVRRFSVGARASILALETVHGGGYTNETSSANLSSIYTTTSKTPRLGGGLTAEFAITRRLSLDADLLYHRFGYDAETTNTETLTDLSTKTTSISEITYAKYWDLPVLARVYIGPRENVRFFVTGGVTLRRVSSIITKTHTTNPDFSQTVEWTPRSALNRTARGFTGGFGVKAIDDFHIKLIPEVRYTRWVVDTFGSYPAHPRRDEVSVLIGLMF